MDFQIITYARAGGIARITLDRPDRLNAISPELLEDLDRACEAMEGDPGVRVVTLTAAGRTFCAGADLRAVKELSPDAARWDSFMRLWHRVFDRIAALPVPVIAGVHGLALAGGLELVLVADLVVADEAARLGDQHAHLPFEQRMRDVIGLEIGDGAAEVMKMVVARELMGRESLPY